MSATLTAVAWVLLLLGALVQGLALFGWIAIQDGTWHALLDFSPISTPALLLVAVASICAIGARQTRD